MIVEERPSAVVTSEAGAKCSRTVLALAVWTISLFLAGFGAKVWLISRFATPLPFWDQWEEALSAYIPYYEGHLSLALLLRAQNEHRIFFTRIYGLLLLVLNGQWDGQLQMIANAAVHVAAVCGLGWVFAKRIGGRIWLWLWAPLAAVVSLPFTWENTLSGFQSQFAFMVLFSLATIILLGLNPAGSLRWCLGVVTGFCALFTVASGFIASAAVICLLLLKIVKSPPTWKKHATTMAVCAVFVLLGLVLKADVPHHHKLMAHSPMEFLISLGANLAWPWIVVAPFGVVNFLPLAILGWSYLRSREPDSGAAEITLVVGFWTLLSAAASAFARGAGGALPQWRYMDSASFALVTNSMAIAVLMIRYRAWKRFVLYGRIACIGWALIIATGLWLLNARAWNLDIPERVFYHRAQLRNVRAYMATGDIAYLHSKEREQQALFYPPDAGVADPDTAAPRDFAAILNNQSIRARLPACGRDPLTVLPIPAAESAFVPRGWDLNKPDPETEKSWGSYNAQGAKAVGTFESQPVAASHYPYLEIDVAGQLGEPGLSLELVELDSQKRTPVRPDGLAGGRWQPCYVKAPRGSFKIVATDGSATGWFAFKEPREVGLLSYLAIKLMRFSSVLFFGGLAMYVATITACVLKSRLPSERHA